MSINVKMKCAHCGKDVKEAQELLDFMMAHHGEEVAMRYKLAVFDSVVAERDWLRSVVGIMSRNIGFVSVDDAKKEGP